MKYCFAITTVLLLFCGASLAEAAAGTDPNAVVAEPNLVLIHSHAAFAEPNAVLIVEVINNTENGASVEADEVIVELYKDHYLFDTLEGKADANGVAVFENVPTGRDTVALPRAKHQDMMFNGPIVVLKATEESIAAKVTVFDVSFDTSKLSIATHHIIIKSLPDSLEFTEFMQLTNTSGMAISSKKLGDKNRPIILEILLPKGFSNLKLTDYFKEDALVFTEKGFYDTMAVPPGKFSLNFSYTIDINSKTLDIAKGISVATSNLILFAELGQGTLVGLGEPDRVAAGPNGTEVAYYKRSNLAAGDELVFQITGFNVVTSDSTTWVVLAVVFGIVAVVVVVRMRPGKS